MRASDPDKLVLYQVLCFRRDAELSSTRIWWVALKVLLIGLTAAEFVLIKEA